MGTDVRKHFPGIPSCQKRNQKQQTQFCPILLLLLLLLNDTASILPVMERINVVIKL